MANCHSITLSYTFFNTGEEEEEEEEEEQSSSKVGHSLGIVSELRADVVLLSPSHLLQQSNHKEAKEEGEEHEQQSQQDKIAAWKADTAAQLGIKPDE